MFCAHSREYWLSRTAEGGGGMGKRKRKERKKKCIIFCPQDFCAYLSRKNHTNKYTLDLLSNKTEKSEVSGPLNKQHSLPGEGRSPDNSGMHIPCMWMKITGCFEGARKNVNDPMHHRFFCLAQKMPHLSVFLFLPNFIYY